MHRRSTLLCYFQQISFSSNEFLYDQPGALIYPAFPFLFSYYSCLTLAFLFFR